MALNEMLAPSGIGGGAVLMLFFIFIAYLIFLAGLYVYTALALSATAKRLKYSKPWLAWIPVANMWLFPALAKMHWWPILILLLGFILYFGAVFASLIPGMMAIASLIMLVYYVSLLIYLVYFTIWFYKICKFRNKPGWWAVLAMALIFAGTVLTEKPLIFAGTVLTVNPLGFVLGLPILLLGSAWQLILLGILAWSKK